MMTRIPFPWLSLGVARMRTRYCALAVAVLLLLVLSLRADTPVTTGTARLSPDEQLLQSAYLESTGPALLRFFRQQAQGEVEPQQLQTWIAELAQPANVHRPAAAALVSVGAPAAPALREAANGLDD